MDDLTRKKFAAWAFGEILNGTWDRELSDEDKLARSHGAANLGYMALTASDEGVQELFDGLIPEARLAILGMDLDALKERPLIDTPDGKPH